MPTTLIGRVLVPVEGLVAGKVGSPPPLAQKRQLAGRVLNPRREFVSAESCRRNCPSKKRIVGNALMRVAV
jgi:hypothetical protein